jgi:hypothetical protein
MEEPEKILKDLYYGPAGFMNKQTLHKLAIKKDPRITLNYIQKWLNSQNINQIFNKPSMNNNYDRYGHFYINEPNKLHMIDILFIAKDGSYNYILCLIDVATRFKAAMPLKTKSANEISQQLEKIYNTSKYLKWPVEMNCDNGSEFKAQTKQLLEKHNVKINYGAVGNHNHQCFVEIFNRDLAIRLYKQLYHEEIQKNIIYNKWVNILQPTVLAMNNEIVSSIKMTPIEAMKMHMVPQKIYDVNDCPPLTIGSTVRYLTANDEVQNISNSIFKDGLPTKVVTNFEKKRATDPKYSLKKYVIESCIVLPNNPRLYELSGIDDKYFTGSRLKEVSPD